MSSGLPQTNEKTKKKKNQGYFSEGTSDYRDKYPTFMVIILARLQMRADKDVLTNI